MSINIYGIAGYMGAGKSTFTEIFSKKATSILNVDAIAKEFMQNDLSIKTNLISEFGNDICQNGSINSKALGMMVFNNSDNLQKLNNIVHPPIIEYLRRLIDDKVRIHTDQLILVDAALIPLWKIESWFDTLIWVETDSEIRLQRLLGKYAGTITEADLRRRITGQEQLFSCSAQYKWVKLVNNATKDVFRNECFELLYNFH